MKPSRFQVKLSQLKLDIRQVKDIKAETNLRLNWLQHCHYLIRCNDDGWMVIKIYLQELRALKFLLCRVMLEHENIHDSTDETFTAFVALGRKSIK